MKMADINKTSIYPLYPTTVGSSGYVSGINNMKLTCKQCGGLALIQYAQQDKEGNVYCSKECFIKAACDVK